MRTTTTSFEGRRLGRPIALLAAALLGALALSMTSAPAPAAAAVEWTPRVFWAPTNFSPGARGTFTLRLDNTGDTASNQWPTTEVELPEGVTFDANDIFGSPWGCEATGDPQTVTCGSPFGEFFEPIKPFTPVALSITEPIYLKFTVDIAADAPEGTFPVTITSSGVGAPTPTVQVVQLRIDDEQLGFAPNSFKAGAFDETGAEETQAGAHPDSVSTSFKLNTRFIEPPAEEFWENTDLPAGFMKDVIVDAPPGLAGNPLVGARCETPNMVQEAECPIASQVGLARYGQRNAVADELKALYNMMPPKGAPAQFAFSTPAGAVLLTPVLRSDGDWALSVSTRNLPEAGAIFYTTVTLWGVPADPIHDEQRCHILNAIAEKCIGYDTMGGLPTQYEPSDLLPHVSTEPREPFLSNPTRCDGEEDVTSIHMSEWDDPAPFLPSGDPDLSSPKWKTATDASPPLEGCDGLEFAPTLKARPTTNVADSPTGLDVDLHLPQSEDPDGLATAHMRDATVTLPEGLVVNPSGANGLGACSPSQVGLTTPVGEEDARFTREPDNCPESSKIGTVQVDTPVLDHPIPGAVYVAEPHNNPFDSLLAIYIALNDLESGIVGKLAGEVSADPQTGRLTTTFKDNPQTPFEDFHLDFFGGAAASLKTPPTCGTYTTTSELIPWSAPDSGPPATPSDTWSIVKAPSGSCTSSEAELPNSPTMQAGSAAPVAGAHSPFVVNLRRADGTQRFESVTVSPPPGLLAKLAGTSNCPDSALAAAAAKDGKDEQSSPSCPASSRVGTVVAGAGAGPAPYYAHGNAYLAGPYKGAPMSLAFVTPAVAGPFDLGTIVVRAAVHVDPRTAQITAVSDEIPQILEGIPLDVRSVSVRIDRPDFTLNPTSCERTEVKGQATSVFDQPAALTSPFQVGECGRLGFKPNLRLFLKGGTKRGDYQRLTAVLKARPGDANIARAQVALPSAFFLAQEHIRTVCTRVQFAADACPKGSVYGKATATTPLLDGPLTGPVYLRSSDNTLPDLVAALKGPEGQPIEVELSGRTDSFKRGIRNTFSLVPDAPVTKFVLQLQGGRKSLVVNSTDVCANPQRATARFKAHNDMTQVSKPLMRTNCGKSARKGKGKKRAKR